MKPLLVSIFILCLHLSASFADSKKCNSSVISLSPILKDFISDNKDVVCKELEQQNQCAEKSKINPNLRQEVSEGLDLIDSFFLEKNNKREKFAITKRTSEALTDVQNNIGGDKVTTAALATLSLKYTKPNGDNQYYALNETFKKPDNSKEIKYYNLLYQNDKQVELSSAYHDFLSMGSQEKNFSKFKDLFLDSYIAFNNEYNCSKTRVRNTFSKFFFPRTTLNSNSDSTCFQLESELTKHKSEIENYFKNANVFGERSIKEKMYVCNETIHFQPQTVAAATYPPCTAKLSKYFDDNKWAIKKDDFMKDPEYVRFQECLGDAAKKNLPISGVTITSSASQLNNTGTAATTFCPKGFLALSKARAESAKNFMLESIPTLSTANITINSEGTNGNGTSGPCPYELTPEGREKFKTGYEPGGSKRETLESSKYVTIHVAFTPKTVKATSKTCYEAYLLCQQLRYQCDHWDRDTWELNYDRKHLPKPN